MPRSVIESGYDNFVLSAEKIPGQVVSCVRNVPARQSVPEATAEVRDALLRISALIRSRTGHDFSSYKQNMFLRRIQRRMALLNIEDIGLYDRYLHENPGEAKKLFVETLILVSSFFRDYEAFVALKEHILPELFRDKPEDYEIRVWTAACARGEEAYSVAMTMQEYVEERRTRIRYQVFGTDLDPDAIALARRGLYPAAIASEVSHERLNRFFTREEGGYRIISDIRERVVFAVHNVIEDPPFARLDFVSCRNMLIYLEPATQDRVIRLFHYALKPGGILFLGPSENVGDRSDLFSSLDPRLKFFRAQGAAKTYLGQLYRVGEPDLKGRGFSLDEDTKKPDPAALVARLVMERFGPPSVLTDEKGRILYFYSDTTRFLPQRSGRPTDKIYDLAREHISSALDMAYRQALREKKEITREGVMFKADGDICQVTLVVRPLFQKDAPPLLLVTFLEERDREKKITREATEGGTEVLEQELRYTRESLRSTIDDLQHSNEDLRLANEELQSLNEELQSTAEQREVTREELQSLNEEMSSVNSELHLRVEQLSETEAVLENLINNTNVGTIYLDEKLRIVRFTPEATHLVPLVAGDIGRFIGDIAINAAGRENLGEDATHVLATQLVEEKEVRAKDGRLYLMRTMPLKAPDQQKRGVVVTFTNVTLIKALAEEKTAREYAEAVVDSVREPLVVLDATLHVVSANRAFYDLFGVPKDETLGRLVYDLGNGQWNIPALRKLLQELLPRKKTFHDFRVERDFPSIGRKTMLLNARMIDHDRKATHILLAIEDITDQGQIQRDRGEDVT
jgi:two-component system CheB/CheR fusion protein